ncbi:CRISPR-associated endoribonuclease Cas6 [Thermodesulfobium sp. 4217-1]|uniref:CRISPR-associated endoribonuclease Cas6 n=1 Tax=Thermodesulfobium sp. 4217-1 TaxID=3120013 RepID=UPI003221F161
MRIRLKFISNNFIVLSSGYNSLIQGLIYNLLDYIDAKKLHDGGFMFEKRQFRLFTFSEIIERGVFNRSLHTISFDSKMSFIISSPVEWILKQIAINSFKGDVFRLGDNLLQLEEVSVLNSLSKDSFTSNEIKIKALTPIEVHSTFVNESKSRKTYYYSPFEKEFSYLINQNARKKWSAYFKSECEYNLEIKPLFKDNSYETIRYFVKDNNKTIIKGWKGIYNLKGEPEFLKFILDAGLGSRNSQGLGFVEVVNNLDLKRG